TTRATPRRPRSLLGSARRRYSAPLHNLVNSVHRQPAKTFQLAARPVTFHALGDSGRAEPEMQPQIILRDVTGATLRFVNLRSPARHDTHAGADSAAVRNSSDALDLDPVIRAFQIIPQQARQVVDVVNHYVDITVII